MKKFLFLFLLTTPSLLHSQVTFIINSLPANTPPGDLIYIVGSFNGWAPGDPAYALSKNSDQKWSITMPAQSEGNVLQFKFTRGSWETVEKGAQGEEIANREFTFGNGDTVGIIIYNWAQGTAVASTAADNVYIMSDNFDMPQLGRTRRIWIYLPPAYETSGLSYPVLYMQDGQNLFDDSTSFAGEWHVDETLNTLYDQGYNVPIVIGIENGGDYRNAEYTPWQHALYGGGEGSKYMEFIVQTLKPYVDQNYRTLPEREFTGLMGSSLGGLISHFGSLKYQDVFSKAGIFSPSYWWSDSVWTFTRETGRQDAMRIYMMCGGMEGQGTINNMTNMQDTLLQAGFSADELSLIVIPGGEHNETLWSGNFGEAYLWLFASYTNNISDPGKINVIRLFPNPTGDQLALPPDFPESCDSLTIIDMLGNEVLKFTPFAGRVVDVSGLAKGTYLVSVFANGKYYQGKVVKE
jgi:predicted alpha/beta superfamily hydrolase